MASYLDAAGVTALTKEYESKFAHIDMSNVNSIDGTKIKAFSINMSKLQIGNGVGYTNLHTNVKSLLNSNLIGDNPADWTKSGELTWSQFCTAYGFSEGIYSNIKDLVSHGGMLVLNIGSEKLYFTMLGAYDNQGALTIDFYNLYAGGTMRWELEYGSSNSFSKVMVSYIPLAN